MLLKIVQFLLLLFLPSQLGVHFWPQFSRVVGIKVDYLSPVLYAVDIIILIYILLSLPSVKKQIAKHKKTLILFIAVFFINTIFSASIFVSLYWWLRLTMFLFLFIALKSNKIKWNDVKIPLTLSTLLVVIISIVQTINQSSIGGLFYYLGERTYSSSTPNIARLSINGFDYIRSPSIFSHPNSLAGYLLIVLFLFYKYRSPIYIKIFTYVGILLTLSKTAIASILIILFNSYYPIILIITPLLSVSQLFTPPVFANWQSFSDRSYFLEPTKKMISEHIFTGVGYGNYIATLPNYVPGFQLTPSKLQPVHNLPLLFIAEFGLFGILAVIASIYMFIKNNNMKNSFLIHLLVLILLTGFFDHYWYTLIQNRLIAVLAFALII